MKELSMHILDIAQNSIRAKASLIEISIEEQPDNDLYIISIKDNGRGMSPEVLEKAIDPFFTSRTTRKVGLGLSLLKQNAELTGGSFTITSEEGKGTSLVAIFHYSHFDRPILGDIVGTLLILFAESERINFVYSHRAKEGEFIVRTEEILQELDGVPISSPEVRAFLIDYLSDNLKQIQISE